MADVLATFAQFERRLIGRRTREALAVKKQGIRLGRPPSISPQLAKRIRPMRTSERADYGPAVRSLLRRLDLKRGWEPRTR